MTAPPIAECPVLRGCAGRYAAASERVDRMLDGLGVAQALWSAAPGAWSVAECIDHLVVTGVEYLPFMQRAIARGRDRSVTGRAPYGRGTFFGRYILSALDPDRPSPKRVGAPRVFRPRGGTRDTRTLAETFRSMNDRLLELVAAADGLDLGRIRFGTPVSRLVRVSLDQAFRIHAVHEERHLDQASRVLADPGLPGA